MFFRKKIFKSPEQKEAEALPRTKKVQYVAEDIKEITERLIVAEQSIKLAHSRLDELHRSKEE